MTALRVLEQGRERRPRPRRLPGAARRARARRCRSRRAAGPLAWLGLADGEVFVQPVAGRGAALQRQRGSPRRTGCATATCCASGRRGSRCGLRGADVVLARRRALGEANPTEPPVVLVPPPRGEGLDDAAHEDPAITPIALRRRGRSAAASRDAARASPGRCSRFALLLVLAGASLLVLSRLALVELRDRSRARTASRCAAAGRRCAWARASLALPGRYTLAAEKDGYRRLEAPVEVRAAGRCSRFALRPLPGPPRRGHRRASQGPRCRSTAARVGTTPLAAFEVGGRASARSRSRATGYEEHRATRRGRGARSRAAARAWRSCRCPRRRRGRRRRRRPARARRSRASPTGRARRASTGRDRGATPLELRARAGPAARACALAKAGHDDAELSLDAARGRAARGDAAPRAAARRGAHRGAAARRGAARGRRAARPGRPDAAAPGGAARDRDPARGLRDARARR